MVKERVSNKTSWKHFSSSEKKMANKSCFVPELTKAVIDALVDTEELLILEFLIKQLFYSGLLDIKWL